MEIRVKKLIIINLLESIEVAYIKSQNLNDSPQLPRYIGNL